MPKIAIYPGSFDPITRGHEEIMQKASKLFDQVYVVVCINSNKPNSLFTSEERLAMLKKVTAKYPNIEADSYEGMAFNYAIKKGAVAMIRGVRNARDFDAEIAQYYFNHKINRTIETVILMPDVTSLYISSSAVKELASFNRNFSKFVPVEIYDDIKDKLAKDPFNIENGD
jgi:pantetheine-phosphate adenylyltransferase